MKRYIILAVLVCVALGHAHKAPGSGKSKRHRQRIQPVVDYDEDYETNFDYSDYGKESNPNTRLRPWTISYWGNLLRRTRLPSLNITNPFTKLFNPYVIKVDFPPGTDPNQQPTRRPNKDSNSQQDYIYLNAVSDEVEQDTPPYFYDPVTQQYYEVVETASDDYSPENNYYATTFNDEDAIEINLDDTQRQQDEIETSSEELNQEQLEQAHQYIQETYNEPAVKSIKSKSRRRMQRRPRIWFSQ